MTSANPANQSQQPTRSYASVSKTFSPTPTGTSTPSGATTTTAGSGAPTQHGKASPVSGKTPSTNMQNGEHGRKASVIITAQGTSGQMPNGAPPAQSNRPNINFGGFGNGPQGSPAIASSVPSQAPSSSLTTPKADPRITSPTHSPTPIPQPAASGGKPPSLPSQTNGLSFGSLNAENGDASNRGPNAPLTPSAQPAHLRRESSQSAHSDMSTAGMQRNFMPSNGRGGRGGYMQQNNFVPHSPAQSYRQLPNQQRVPNNMQNQFQNQQQMGSPYRNNNRNSPAMLHAQPFMPQNQMYGGHGQQYLNPQQQAFYGGQPPYDPNTGYYQPYYPGYNYNAPPSPRPGQPYPMTQGGPPHNMQPYHNPMSRSASQISERPSSSVGPSSSVPPPSQSSHTPAPSSTPASSSAFQIPPKKASKAIVIKNDKGEEITFDNNNKKPSPAPAAIPQSPAIVSSSAPTPPPRTPSVQHIRAESKTADQTKNEFQEQVKRQLEAQREAEKQKEDAAKKIVTDKEEADKKAVSDKEEADRKAASDKEEAEKKAAADKEEADKKAALEKEQAENAAKEKEEADARAAKEKEDAEAAEAAKQKETEAAEKAAAETQAKEDEKSKAAAEPTESEEDRKAREQREEDERLDREIEEMERLEEEREKAYQEKRRKEKEAQAEKDKEAAKKADEEMKRLEREAEELEIQREKERENQPEESSEDKAEAEKLFASLKKPTLGPGAEASTEEADEAVSEDAVAAPAASAAKPKPAALKLETSKPVEPAQPTPGMQALKSARFLEIQNADAYPSGFKSPNPALNQSSKRAGKEYDMAFLLQFQNVFKEKPTIDWDQKIKDTLGDGEPSSARAASSRGGAAMGGRQPSRGTPAQAFAMGSFAQGARTLPPGTSSQDRFNASNAAARGGMAAGVPQFGGRGGGFPMGAPPGMNRTPSMQQMGPGGNKMGGASRRGGTSKRGQSGRPDREDADKAKNMPLTAGMEIKSLEKSTTGWTPRSLTEKAPPIEADGQMPPEMVQRKVKAALNKMTPENFERISDQIMTIANQSKNEKDGRTLRQVIQLTFEKACDEAHWAGTYAKFCSKMLTSMSNEIVDETIRDKNNQPVVGGGLFRKYLLNRCQEEFERGWEANLPDKPEGESQEAALLSDEYYIAAAAKRRGLGLIQFIGELYKLGMLTVKIMHQCVLRLLNFEGQPDESAVENLSKLLKAVGSTMDSNEQGHQLVNIYYDRVNSILETHKDMPSRPKFMLMDIVDLRKKGWRSKDTDKGPKTIEEIHAEAEAAQAAAELERQKNTSRGGGGGRPPIGRGDARGFPGQGGMPPPDYPKNQLGMDDLRRLQNRGASRQASQGLGPNLGPGGFLGSRNNSGRKGLGPPKDGETSGNSSRAATPGLTKKEEPTTTANAFSALAALDGEGAEPQGSAQSEAGSPPVTKAQPASIDETASTTDA